MELSNAKRQVDEILNLQDMWFAKDGGIEIKTPALFDRLQKLVGYHAPSSPGRLEVKKQLALEIKCSILYPDELSDLLLSIEFPHDYPSSSICKVRALRALDPYHEYSACSEAINKYLELLIGCECTEMIIDWISENKDTCLNLSSGNKGASNGEREGQVLCYVLRYNHLLSGPEHKKEKAMVTEAKKSKVQGGILWGTPGIVVVVPPSTESDAKEYASDCRTIGKRAEGPSEIWLPRSGLDQAGMGGVAQQKRGGKLQELDTVGLRCGCGGDENLLREVLGVN
jgi:hypothetical protein